MESLLTYTNIFSPQFFFISLKTQRGYQGCTWQPPPYISPDLAHDRSPPPKVQNAAHSCDSLTAFGRKIKVSWATVFSLKTNSTVEREKLISRSDFRLSLSLSRIRDARIKTMRETFDFGIQQDDTVKESGR